ncbi:McrB family protein [Actinoalloteichus sp. GBA129-24]|uniref:McrB family protein n=1 Tax=Actinoalloteichus sp. GBA129-24 TaxID=1612551 RepID=UPI001E41F3E8|nr:AAA family ATPase [Actinoalloteichus sp. GBA129-24]
MSDGETIYTATRRLLVAGLTESGAAFTPSDAVWTAAAAEDLLERVTEPNTAAEGQFIERLRAKLVGASSATIQLAGEMVYLHLLVPDDVGGETKAKLVETVLSADPKAVMVPPELTAALFSGFARPGPAYRAYRGWQLAWLLRFALAWRALVPATQEEALRDPWSFRRIADSFPVDRAYSQRNALLHLAFPGTFEGVVSRRHKRLIIDAFAGTGVEVSGDDDRDLIAVRAAVERRHGGRVDFYDPELMARWHPEKALSPTSEAAGLVLAEIVEEETSVLLEPTAALAAGLFVDQSWLSETVDLLREQRQLILYGPPGTGKTYLAQELARFLTAEVGGEHRLVQFHPSYAYEDFFEGFRPRRGEVSGTVAFDLEPGPLRLLADRAAQAPDVPFVLIIDEINRANLAKVFGELYFLLEYRDRSVRLQYSPTTDFRLPSNLYVIGTMNTADRSIALVDSAMRRRFAWQGLFPGEPPVADMLRRWLHAHDLPDDRADLLDALNARIAERDAAVGPSYLMNRRVGTEPGLARIWRHHILPLMEERHVGEGLDIEALYGLAALRSGTGRTATRREDAPPLEETGEPSR